MGREAGALLIAMALALAAMPRMIVWLRRLGARQSIHEDVPEAHQAKAGTPTMGGVVILLALATATLWLTGFDVLTGPALLLTLAFGAIGFLDDLLIAKRGKNLGLRAREKLALQVIAATLFVVVVSRFTSAAGPAGGWLSLEPLARLLSAPLAGVWPGAFGAAYVVLDVLFLLGLANAVNFSDGLDGLAGGLTVIAALTAALLLPPGLQNTLGVFLFALAGGCLGF
ncbi:MAG TPA: phospho-N-acetylmuramoyl-pentapeptide-transferase, partial [Armatimonadota bacterium]|nr:phospho-N-acetylmuramoyl-pentapeptide-transferase [Armatimonadota bacterium]